MNKLIVDALDLLVTTDKGLEEIVDTLLREADIQGMDADKLRQETLSTLRTARTQVVDRTAGVVDRITVEALRRLHLPNGEDLRKLTEAVEGLRADVARLHDRLDHLTAHPPEVRQQGG